MRSCTISSLVLSLSLLVVNATAFAQNQPTSADPKAEQEVRAAIAKIIEAFSAGKTADVEKLFLPNAELDDESGTVHSGRESIAALAGTFAERFPGAKMTAEIESINLVAPDLALVEAIRTTTTADGTESARTRSSVTLAKRDGQWSVAAVREVPAEDELSPHDRLASLAWMVGDWIDEGTESVVDINCRWSEDGNFLLIEHTAKVGGQTALKTSQRLGWDPIKRQVHSWMFDSDGGYGEGEWTRSGTTWTIKSTAVLPDGVTGSATFTVEPQTEDRFVMKAEDRVLGETVEPDSEVIVVRKPAAAAKKP